MIDFPASPTVGQTFTSGGVVWLWDGVKWTSTGAATGLYLPITGGTLTGDLILNRDPAVALGAATKQYIDNKITGVTDGSDAAPGQIGEFISSNVIAPGVTLATTVNKIITSINLTPGDWDVSAEGWVAVGAALPTLLQLGVSPSGGQPNPAYNTARVIVSSGFGASTASVYALKTCRASLSAPATYSLAVNLSFPSGTCTAYGNINARRVR